MYLSSMKALQVIYFVVTRNNVCTIKRWSGHKEKKETLRRERRGGEREGWGIKERGRKKGGRKKETGKL